MSNKPLNNGQCWFPRVLFHWTCLKQLYSLSDPRDRSCLVPCVPCPVEPPLAVCSDQLTPDRGSADQPHKLCSKSHTAVSDGIVAAKGKMQIVDQAVSPCLVMPHHLFSPIKFKHLTRFYCV